MCLRRGKLVGQNLAVTLTKLSAQRQTELWKREILLFAIDLGGAG
jgi:hypothetical protein